MASALRARWGLRPVLILSCLATLASLATTTPSALAKPGDLDSSFGKGGKVTRKAQTGTFEWGPLHSVSTDIASLPQGGTVVLTARAGYGFSLYGFETDGSISPDFGAVRIAAPQGSDLELSDVAVDSRSRVLVAGSSLATTGTSQPLERAFVARYTPRGEPDPTFGDNGVVSTDFGLSGPRIVAGESAQASRVVAIGLAVDQDDRVVLTGRRLSTVGPCRGTVGLPYHEAFVARLDSSGHRDPSFGNGGVVSLLQGPGPGDGIQDVNAPVVDESGKIYLSTRPIGPCDEGEPALVGRLDDSGRADPSFGGEGWVRVSRGAPGSFLPFSIALDPWDRPLLLAQDARSAIVKRVLPGGAVDRTFGRRGVATMGGPGGDLSVAGEAVDPSGRVLIAGTAARSFFVGRLTPRGQIDRGFGRSGRVITGFGARSSITAGGIVADQRGRAVVAGTLARVPATGRERLALVRLLGGRSLP